MIKLEVGTGVFSQHVGDCLKPGQGVAGKVWQTEEPLVIDDYHTLPDRAPSSDFAILHALLGIPLIFGLKVMGVLGVARSEDNRSYTAAEINRLTRFGELAVVALDNARLYTAAQQELAERKQLEQRLQKSLEYRTRQMQSSTEVAQEIATAPTLDGLFERVVNLVQQQFGYHHACVYTLENDHLVMQAGTGDACRQMKESGYKIALAAEKRPVARSAQSGDPILIPDVTQDPAWLPNPWLPETKSELAVPIKFQDKVLGVLNVHSGAGASLSQEDQILLMGLCGQLSVAIQNLVNFEQTQHRARRERLIYTLSTDMRKSVNPETILKIGVETIGRELGKTGIVVQLNPESNNK